MTSSLLNRLMAARHDRFVGRGAEQAAFQAAIQAERLPFNVLYLYAPGGFGKTTLLLEMARFSREQSIPTFVLDARHIEPTPAALSSAWAQTVATTLQPAAVSARQVICIDTFEIFEPIEAWVRDIWLPQFSEDCLIVVASRNPISAAWRSAPGWHDLVHVMPLRNLTRAETEMYLTRRGIPPDHQPRIQQFTQGHPLALSLMVEAYNQQQQLPVPDQTTQHLIRTLVERFIQGTPSARHRTALEACALVRVMNEPLLAAMLEDSDAAETYAIFNWLRNLSFVEIVHHGVILHDLTREVLTRDLQWRNAEWSAELHRRARTFFLERLKLRADAERGRLLADLVYLHRDNHAVRAFFDWGHVDQVSITGLQPDDVPTLLAMVEQHEGSQSAAWASHWLAVQPSAARLFRNNQGEIEAFALVLALQHIDDAAGDPAVQAALTFLQTQTRLRAGEAALYFRYWMAREDYQNVSPAQSNIFIMAVQTYLTTPGLAIHFFPVADPEFWMPMFMYADLARMPTLDFTIEDRPFGVYGHDWRSVSTASWMEMLAERENGATVGSSLQSGPPPILLEPSITLTREAFENAVQAALRSLLRADELSENPLVRSRVVLQRVRHPHTSDPQLIATLQQLIKDAADQIKLHPRDSKFYQAVHYTYIHPVATQEQAAELLDLPFSTFRRYLKNGITRIAEILWQQELGVIEFSA